MEPEDVASKLSSKFPEHKFELCKAPLFLQEITSIKDSIILCYNVQIRAKSIRIVQDDSVRSLSTITEASACEGNPLELPSCMDQSLLSLSIRETSKPFIRNSYNYSPLTSHQALKVKGYCNMELNSSVPIVILCDGEVKLVHHNQCKSVMRVVHCSFHSGSWKTSCWSDYYKVESSSLESLAQLREIHFKKAVNPNGKQSRCDVQLRSKSVLTSIDDVNDITEKCSTIAVQFEWSSLSVKPPLDNTEVSLLVDIYLNKAPSVSLCIIWRQLELLQKYMDYLENSTKGDLKNSSLPSAKSFMDEFGFANCELNEDNVDEEMLKLLCGDRLPSISNKENITISKLTDFFANPNSSSSDLTNSLWTKLIGCESYELLQMCFKHFFKHVRSSSKSKSIKKSNITRLAHMIQADQMVLDSYIQLINPVEYLLEIGLEKIRQVLLAIFDCIKVSHSSLNMPNLPKFSEVTNSDDWMKVSKSWLTWLSRVYSALNILSCAEMALGNPQLTAFFPVVSNVVSELCSNNKLSTVTIDSLADIMENPQHTVILKIPMNLLNASSVDTEFFDEWSLTFTSTNKSRNVTSIFYRSPFCPIPYINDEHPSDGSELNSTQLNATYGGNTTVCSSNITACLDNVTCTLHCVETHKISDHFPFLNSRCLS